MTAEWIVLAYLVVSLAVVGALYAGARLWMWHLTREV